jgi:hypothetical protein
VHDERENVGRRPIEPIGVVEGAEQAPLLRREAQQPTDSESDKEWVDCNSGVMLASRRERILLRRREQARVLAEQCEHAIHRCERQACFGLQSIDAEHIEAARRCPRVLEQDGLPDPGLTVENERVIPFMGGGQ